MFKDAKFGDGLVLRDGPAAIYCGAIPERKQHLVMIEGRANLVFYQASGAYLPSELRHDLDVERVKSLRVVYGCRGIAGSPGFGYEVEIKAGTDDPGVFDAETFRAATRTAGEVVTRELMAAAMVAVPGTAEAIEETKQRLLAPFSEFRGGFKATPIPNGYCKDWCCRHKPWYRVSTALCSFTIGWRKCVINIEWDKDLEVDFSSEDVTKEKGLIHAWGYEKAAEYIGKIREAAELAHGKPVQA